MPIVTGTLEDFTTSVLSPARLTFTPSNSAVYAPGGPTEYLFAPKKIYVTPAADGTFAINLFAGSLAMPDSWYIVTIEWADASGGFTGSDYPTWLLRVPPAGGAIADLLLTPWNPTLAWYGPSAPSGTPVPTTLWLNTTTGDLSIWSVMTGWVVIANLGLTASDSAVAAFVASTTSLTNSALALKYAHAMNLETYPGVDPTGVTECHAAIQNALNAASAAGVPLVSNGGHYLINSGIIISDNADLSRAVFQFSGTTGIAIQVGLSGSSISRKIIYTPYVVASAKTVALWGQVAGSIGVRITNTSDCEVHVGYIWNFETGLQFYGQGVGGGVTYCKFWLGTLLNNKRNLHISTDNVSGYANQNQTFGGTFNFSEAAAVAGTRHILIDNVSQVIDGWTFHEPSLEDSTGTAQYTIETWGSNCLIDRARFEVGTGNPKVSWQSGSAGNEIRGGVNVDTIVETITGTTSNKITRTPGVKVITSAHTFDQTDEGKTILINSASAITLTLPSAILRSPNTAIGPVKNIGAGTVTINTSVDNLDGVVTAQTMASQTFKRFVATTLPAAGWYTD